LVIEPISALHNRKLFDCGDEVVTRFLRQQALQEAGKDLSRTMVLVDAENSPAQIVGFHTLLFSQVKQEEIPNDRPLIKRSIPVVLLGQLGIDQNFHGLGHGEMLLMDAQARVAEISIRIGIRAMMLDARTERLARWYEGYDFVRFPGSLRMFKSIGAIRKLNLHA
jgi:GNAT superfamily N-acetyltransferase